MEATHDVNNPRDEQHAGEEQPGPSRLSILDTLKAPNLSELTRKRKVLYYIYRPTVFTEFFAGIIDE